MAYWNQKPERTKKKAKREKRMKQQTTEQLPGVVGVVTKQAAHTNYPTYSGGGAKYGHNYGIQYGHYTSRPVVPTPEDTKDTSKLSIVLMRQSVLNAISAICQPVAGASEFQVHYRSLVVRIKNEANELIINIPTAFYNFKQTVAHSSVDYHLDDIDKAAEELKPLSDKIVQDIFREMPLLSALPVLFEGQAEVTFSESNSGSIHRHPGRFGFSGTDYTKTPSNPGVIYREAEATDKVHTDSVIYLGARTEIYTTETRILNIRPKDNGVEGTYCQLPTTTFLLNDLAKSSEEAKVNSMVEFLGGLEEGIKDSSGDFYITNAMGAITGYALVTEIINAFKEANFEQDISMVLASHISGRYNTYLYGGTGVAKKQENSSAVVRRDYGYWGDGFDDYDMDDTYYEHKYSGAGYWHQGKWVQGNKAVNKVEESTTQATAQTASKSHDKLKNPYPIGTPGYADWNLRNKERKV